MQQWIGGVLHAGTRPAAEARMTFMMLGNRGNGMLHMMAAPLACGPNGFGEMAALFATCLNSLPHDLETTCATFIR